MAQSFNGVAVPADGARISYKDGRYQIPDNPIVPFIEGDGTGRDIWKASVRVFNAAVEKAYKGKRRVAWYEVFAGEKAKAKFDTWLPDDIGDDELEAMSLPDPPEQAEVDALWEQLNDVIQKDLWPKELYWSL